MLKILPQIYTEPTKKKRHHHDCNHDEMVYSGQPLCDIMRDDDKKYRWLCLKCNDELDITHSMWSCGKCAGAWWCENCGLKK